MSTTTSLKWTATTWILVLGIVFISLTLRSPLTAVGPVIETIKNDLHISNVVAGFITTIPLLAFAVISPIAPVLARKLSIEKTLLIAIIILIIGIALRSSGYVSLLFIGTALIGVGIAFGNVLLPSLIKLKFPLQIGLLTAIFTVSMNTSAAISAGISYPISSLTNWQSSLGIWLIFAIIALVIWLPQTAKSKNQEQLQTTKTAAKKPMWRYPLAWVIMVAMGSQSLIFYTTATWIPQMYKSQGMSAAEAGVMFSIMQLAQIPMTFITPIIASKLKDQRIIVAVFAALYIIGFAGLLFGWTDYSIAWMISIGLAGGASFSMCMMYFSLRSKDAFEAADLSGFAQSLGYLLAAFGPVLYGYFYDHFQSFDKANILYIVVVVLCIISSFISAKNRYVTDYAK